MTSSGRICRVGGNGGSSESDGGCPPCPYMVMVSLAAGAPSGTDGGHEDDPNMAVSPCPGLSLEKLIPLGSGARVVNEDFVCCCCDAAGAIPPLPLGRSEKFPLPVDRSGRILPPLVSGARSVNEEVASGCCPIIADDGYREKVPPGCSGTPEDDGCRCCDAGSGVPEKPPVVGGALTRDMVGHVGCCVWPPWHAGCVAARSEYKDVASGCCDAGGANPEKIPPLPPGSGARSVNEDFACCCGIAGDGIPVPPDKIPPAGGCTTEGDGCACCDADVPNPGNEK